MTTSFKVAKMPVPSDSTNSSTTFKLALPPLAKKDIFRFLTKGCIFPSGSLYHTYIKQSQKETKDEDSSNSMLEPIPTMPVSRKELGIKVTGEDVPPPVCTFSNMPIPEWLKAKLSLRYGIKVVPTPVQAQAIPLLCSQPERDAMIIAPTGTGKTLVFLSTLLSKQQTLVEKEPSLSTHSVPTALVVSPTKELAMQTETELKKLVDAIPDSNNKTHDSIVVSTPKTLYKRIKDKSLDVSRITDLILDEADKLLDKGFLEQIDQILTLLRDRKSKLTLESSPLTLRILLFSATIPTGVEHVARSFMNPDLVRITVGHHMSTLTTIRQELLFVGTVEGKPMAIRNLVARSDGTMTPPIIVFTEEAEEADRVAELLSEIGLKAHALHSTSANRAKVLEEFRGGIKVWTLVTTELCARGLDIPLVNLIINWDFPTSTASYIHRIGRTGRAGASGHAITFFTLADKGRLAIVTNVIKASSTDKDGTIITIPKWMERLKDERRMMKKSLERGKKRKTLEKEAYAKTFLVNKKLKRSKSFKGDQGQKRQQKKVTKGQSK